MLARYPLLIPLLIPCIGAWGVTDSGKPQLLKDHMHKAVEVLKTHLSRFAYPRRTFYVTGHPYAKLVAFYILPGFLVIDLACFKQLQILLFML